MASQAYYDWVRTGEPWKFATPIKAVGDRLKAHGYTVYYQGNNDHLTHEPPEDHTPFSATGWPGKSPYPYCMAMDIMPPTAGQKSKIDGRLLPSLQQIAARLRQDKIDGHAAAKFVKYLNWEPEGNYVGPCYHDSWMSSYARRASGDRGHIHVSARSDYHTSTASNGYDLVARVLGEEDDDMPSIDELLAADRIPNDINPGVKGQPGYNETITVLWALRYASRAKLALDEARAIRKDVGALASAVASIGSTGKLTQQQITALQAAVDQVDEQVADRLVGETPEQTAAALKVVLGDQAADVGRILAGG